jgi:hypothetical protein
MPLDTRIALGVQPLRVQFRDLGADYNQLLQMRSAENQNQLAQMQMQESRQLAPLRLQEQQSRAATAKRELDDLNEAQTYVKSVMTEAANKSGGTAPKDPFAAAKQMIDHPNAQVQAAGLRLLESSQKLQDYKAEADYQTFRGQPVAGAPAVAAPGAVNATPVGPTTSPAAGIAIKPIAKGVFADSTVSPENIRQLEKLGDQATFFDPTSYWTQNSDGKLVVGRSGTPVSATPAAAAGAPAQPDMANALAMKIQGLEAQRNQLRPLLKSPSAKADFDALGKQIDKLSEGFSIPAGGARYQPGVGMIERPAAAPAPSELARLMTEREQAKTSGASPQILASYDAAINKQINFAPPMQVVMPVAVEDPSRPGSVIYVDRSEAIGKTPATAIEGLGPKEIQAREAKYPQAITALKGFDAKTSKLERDIDELIANKDGLNEITGYIAGRTDLSAMTNAGRRALAKFNTITAKGGFSELQDMRNASPTGGALGNVSNQEGQQLIAAFGSLSRTQNADDLRNSLTTIKSDLQGSKQRVKEAFDATYDYRANRGGAAAPAVPSGRGVDTNNPLLK